MLACKIVSYDCYDEQPEFSDSAVVAVNDMLLAVGSLVDAIGTVSTVAVNMHYC